LKENLRNETFDGTFPFKPHFRQINGFQMHYVDEGRGEPIVCVHGEPTWGYLYRRFIPPLAQSHRVVVPDHMGFGKSDTPQDKPYTLAQHVDNFTKLLLGLDLKDITLIFQDWGGPIAFGFATAHPDRVKRLVIMNTGVGVFPAGTKTWISDLEAQGIAEAVLGDMTSFVPRMLSATLVRGKATEVMIRAYTAPFPDRASCIGAIAFPRDIPVGDNHPSAKTMRAIEQKLNLLKTKPKTVIWGMRDPIFRKGALERWKNIYPGIEYHELADASHFLQEDAPDEIVGIITGFLEKNP
jgi:haloalkane dehalogenase